MIKKIIKSEKLKKILLVILTITMMSTINPVVSNAGMVMSVLTKPISSFVMGCLDAVNALLTILFAPETKYKEAISEQDDINESADSKGLYEKLANEFDDMRDTYYNFLLSPEDIFSGEIQVTNANIFSSDFDKDGKINNSEWNLFNHLMKQLKQATAGLYYITRNLAVVILLCLLIYTGIRIVMASNNANEKAKWKEHLYDWIKALALVMFVHLIMIGIFYISDVITNGLKGAFGGDSIVAHIRSNFDDSSALDVMSSIVYIIMYGYVTYMTIVFLIAYFKRLFYIIVMVIVAPVISSLYALGKTGKEKFDRWLKEFTMGVLVQPFQLLIYSILFLIPMKAMTSGDAETGTGALKVTFGTLDTQIFALIAMGMIRPIEKFMRNIFGFTGTALDNVASFESGNKTVKRGAEFAKVAIDTARLATGDTTALRSLGKDFSSLSNGESNNLDTSTGMEQDNSNNMMDMENEAKNIEEDDRYFEELGQENLTGDNKVAYDELYGEHQQRKERYEEARNIEEDDRYLEELAQENLTGDNKAEYDKLYGENEQRKQKFKEKYGLNISNGNNVTSGNADQTLNSSNGNNVTSGNADQTLNSSNGNNVTSGNADQTLNSGNGNDVTNGNIGQTLDKDNAEQESIKNGNEKSIILNSANIQIGNATGLENNNENTKKTEEQKPNLKVSENENKSNEKQDENAKNSKEDKEKPKIGGQDLSTALLNKLGIGLARRLEVPQKIASKLGEKNPKLKDLSESRVLQAGSNLSAKLNLENISQSKLFEPGMLEQFEKLRQSAHGLTDTFYVDNVGSGGDWKNNITAEYIKEQKEQNEFNFVNNTGNIKEAIKLFGIDKKTDDKDRPLKQDKQEELAKEKLKTMTPYAAMGIKDVGTIKVLMDRGVKPDRALQTLKKDNKGTMNYNEFVENQENIQIMQNMEAEKMGKLSEFKAGDQTVIQQVNQQVQQTISDGAQYIRSGDAKDPETLNRLVELERKLDSKVSIEGSKHYSKSQYIPNIDKIIQKAVKDNIKTIKLPVNKSIPINATIRQKNQKAEISTKALESAMNDVLKERRMQQAGTTRMNSTSQGPTSRPGTTRMNSTPQSSTSRPGTTRMNSTSQSSTNGPKSTNNSTTNGLPNGNGPKQ